MIWLISFSQVLFGCQFALVLAWIAFKVSCQALARGLGLVGLAVAFEASDRTAWWVWDLYRPYATSFDDLSSKFAYTQKGTLLVCGALFVSLGLLTGRALERQFKGINA